MRPASVVLAVAVLTGCEWHDCTDPIGRYAVELVEVSGDCGPVDPFVLEVPLAADGPWLGCSVTNDLDGDVCAASSRVECRDGLSYVFDLTDEPGGDLGGTMVLVDRWYGCTSTYEVEGEGF